MTLSLLTPLWDPLYATPFYVTLSMTPLWDLPLYVTPHYKDSFVSDVRVVCVWCVWCE